MRRKPGMWKISSGWGKNNCYDLCALLAQTYKYGVASFLGSCDSVTCSLFLGFGGEKSLKPSQLHLEQYS